VYKKCNDFSKKYSKIKLIYSSCFKIPEAEHASVASQSGCSGAKPTAHTSFGIKKRKIIMNNNVYSGCFKIPETEHANVILRNGNSMMKPIFHTNCGMALGSIFWIGVTMTFTLLLSGCSGGGIAGLVSCEGIVSLNGQPLENASVTFIPTTGNRSAGGMTNAQGHYKLSTNLNVGVLPGEYKVTITKSVPETEKDALLVQEMTAATEKNNGVIPASYDDVVVKYKSLTGKYGQQQNSDLIVTISNKGNKQQNFDLIVE
jgi:hypothetical protein